MALTQEGKQTLGCALALPAQVPCSTGVGHSQGATGKALPWSGRLASSWHMLVLGVWLVGRGKGSSIQGHKGPSVREADWCS